RKPRSTNHAAGNNLSQPRPTNMAQDLVCSMDVNEQDTRFFTEYNDDKYFFCSAECKRAFDDHPDRFIQQRAKEELNLDQ
ncbi:MAG TPA: YHS domain-containing protein, partial [Bryobacteraceae bacterium]|nr:YHS domain-containing protein [Bryobacteraceae bacterium]